ncbi:MAG: type IV pilus assembly protein PilM [Candidatus Paceibacterota bacterium]
MEILNLQPEAFGLDISSRSLKVAQLEKRGTFSTELTLKGYNEVEVPENTIQKTIVTDQDALYEAIKKGWEGAEEIDTNFVTASLPEEKAFLEIIQMPKISKEEIKKSVKYEAENYIPMSMDEVYFDSEIITPIENSLDHTDVLIVAFPKRVVDPYVSCIKNAGLKPVALEIESQSIARSLIKNYFSRKPLLLIDLGATRTTIMVYSGKTLRFTAYIPISSQQFTRIISDQLGVDWGKAEQLKINEGLGEAGKSEEISEALTPILTDLKEQISNHLEYYETHSFHEHLPSGGGKINKIILTGGGSNLSGLPEFLSSQLGISAELGNPWINILGEDLKQIPKMSFEESTKYTVALGLALRSFMNND